MGSMSVSRQFFLLLLIPFLLVSALALRLIFQFAHFSAEGSRLIQNLQKTVVLNQDLRRGISAQINDLHDQFENLDQHFPQKFGETNYTLGETQTEYLKLDIGEQERLTVERIRALQSELGVMSTQIFERLRMGNRQEASHRLLVVEQLGERIEEKLAALNEYQLAKIRGVSDHLNEYVAGSYRVIFILFASLVLIQGLFGFHLKRRVLLPLNSILEASDRVRELGGEIVWSVMHRNALESEDQEMIRLALTRMKREGEPNLIVLFQRVLAANWMVRAIHESGIRSDILGGDSIALSEFIQTDSELKEGMRISQFSEPQSQNKRSIQFAWNFEAFAGRSPDYAAAFAYDALYLVRDAVLQGGFSRSGVKSYLDRLIREGVRIEGVAGPYTLGTDHDARRALYVAEVRHGSFRLLKALPVN